MDKKITLIVSLLFCWCSILAMEQDGRSYSKKQYESICSYLQSLEHIKRPGIFDDPSVLLQYRSIIKARETNAAFEKERTLRYLQQFFEVGDTSVIIRGKSVTELQTDYIAYYFGSELITTSFFFSNGKEYFVVEFMTGSGVIRKNIHYFIYDSCTNYWYLDRVNSYIP